MGKKEGRVIRGRPGRKLVRKRIRTFFVPVGKSKKKPKS